MPIVSCHHVLHRFAACWRMLCTFCFLKIFITMHFSVRNLIKYLISAKWFLPTKYFSNFFHNCSTRSQLWPTLSELLHITTAICSPRSFKNSVVLRIRTVLQSETLSLYSFELFISKYVFSKKLTCSDAASWYHFLTIHRKCLSAQYRNMYLSPRHFRWVAEL